MKLTRYQFELLSWLEREGDGAYSMRTLSDTLKISASALETVMAELTAVGCLQREGQCLSLTAAALAALEPYRVKRAVIIAAGFGSRMMPATADRPKPLVTVKGVRILDTLLDALVAVGITDITVVRGYKKERFDELLEKYPFLKLVDNDEYDSTNNISSVMLALDQLGGYLCEADLYITDPRVITKYQYASNILGSWSRQTDDWSFRMDDNGYIKQYQKGNTHCYNYYGISYWTEEDSRRLKADFRNTYDQPGGKDYFWEFIPLILCRETYSVEVRPCEKSDVMEIDNYAELQVLDPSYA